MDIVGSVHFPKDCHFSPESYLAALQRRAGQRGATFLWNTRVEGMAREHHRLRAVRTSAGEIEADAFVLCGGVWSDELIRGLGVRLPMQAGKGYSVTLPNPVELPALCSLLAEARVAVTPLGEGLRFGGTMEMNGTSESISPRRVVGILRAVLCAKRGLDVPHGAPHARPHARSHARPQRDPTPNLHEAVSAGVLPNTSMRLRIASDRPRCGAGRSGSCGSPPACVTGN